MQLSRRGFLGALSGVVATGPKAVVKLAEPLGVNALALGGLSVKEPRWDSYPTEDRSWARKKLTNWLLPEFTRKEYREYGVCELHPDLHALRSVSLSAKIRMQKQRSFETYKRKDMHFLERYLRGED